MKTVAPIFFSLVFLLLLTPCSAQVEPDSISPLDYDINRNRTKVIDEVQADYLETIAKWTTIEEVHHWIKNHFVYDFERAVQLANNNKSESKLSIYTPQELWTTQKGICVDLSRFAYETMKAVDSTTYVKYLKIEFEPIEIEGGKFVNHWLIACKKDNQFYFLADSKRPELMDGPYATLDDFIPKYQTFRGRKIVSYKLLDSYKKVKKKKVYKAKTDNKK